MYLSVAHEQLLAPAFNRFKAKIACTYQYYFLRYSRLKTSMTQTKFASEVGKKDLY